MKRFLLNIILLFTVISCSKQSELSNVLDCETEKIENTKTILDFNKNFRIDIPTTWKTDLYYDKYQSELFTADTTKQLTSTYILDVSFNLGKLDFDNQFYKKTDSIIQISNFKKLKSGIIEFQSKPAHWYISKGFRNNFEYHQFNLTVQLSENTYFNAYTDVYGSENVEKRICESISLIETIEFLQ